MTGAHKLKLMTKTGQLTPGKKKIMKKKDIITVII